eukprot:g9944.t1
MGIAEPSFCAVFGMASALVVVVPVADRVSVSMANRTPARTRLLQAAADLFYSVGVGATGIDAITSRAGVAKMSLYNNFSSKSDLVAAYLDTRCEDWRRRLAPRLEAAANPSQRILAIFDSYLDSAAADRVTGFRGCGLLNAASELPRQDPSRGTVAAQKQEVEDLFCRHLHEMGLDEGATTETAQHLSFLLEGAMARAGLQGDERPLTAARTIAASILGRLADNNRLRRETVFPQMLFGALAMSIYLGSFALAISLGVPTGVVALITDMLPLMVAMLSWPVLGQALTARQWFGSMIGFAGVLIASGWSVEAGGVAVWAYLLPLVGTLSLALATLLQKRSPTNLMPVHQSLCIQCLSAAAIFAVFAWYEGGVAPKLDPGFVAGILWLVFVATLGAWSLYYLALRRSSPARVTAVLYLSPPVVMIWAWIMFGEPLSWAMAAGLVVSLAGIVVVARSPRK